MICFLKSITNSLMLFLFHSLSPLFVFISIPSSICPSLIFPLFFFMLLFFYASVQPLYSTLLVSIKCRHFECPSSNLKYYNFPQRPVGIHLQLHMLGLIIISKGRTYTMRSHSMRVLEKIHHKILGLYQVYVR